MAAYIVQRSRRFAERDDTILPGEAALCCSALRLSGCHAETPQEYGKWAISISTVVMIQVKE